MEKKSRFSRYNLLWMIILCYLIPLIGLSIYGTLVPRNSADWNILSLGFFLTAIGALLFFWMMAHWEEALQTSCQPLSENPGDHHESALFHENRQIIDIEEYDLTKRSLGEAQETQVRLLSEIDRLTEELQQGNLNKAEILKQKEKFQTELEFAKKTARQQLERQQNHIRELQEALAEQKTISEKKQQQMMQLETKVGDLTNEIKTLLQLAEAHSGSLLSNEGIEPVEKKPVFSEKTESYFEDAPFAEKNNQTAQEASRQLKHCLDVAQKIKGSQRFGSQIYSFLDSPADSFSLDLRRLCDRLRSENESIILLYSPKNNQLLFASNRIKGLTGWSPEKFLQNFSEILLDESEWKLGISSLAMSSEAQIQIKLKTKSGPNLLIHAALGMIPTGIFRNHTIAVLY